MHSKKRRFLLANLLIPLNLNTPKTSMAKRVKKYGFISTLRLTVSLLLLFIAIFTLGTKTYIRVKEGKERAQTMRSNYINEQRRLIKFEVDRVVKIVDYEVDKHLREAQNIARQRTLEAYSIATHIYAQNKEKKTDKDIKQIIIDAIRPIHFDNGNGYYFINTFDGVPQLVANAPELEGTNMFYTLDSRGKPFLQNMIDIARFHKEGFSSYYWSKPTDLGNDQEKISYVKHFEPYDWVIGSEANLGAVTKSMQNIITHYVTTNRFGPNERGYVFINELLDIAGGKEFAKVYANPNRPNDTGKTISDDFKDANGKLFRKEFLQGLRDNGECFVDYSYKKINNATPSPKTSFFKLAGSGRFIVAAGLYTDDIESEITQMQERLKKRLMYGFLLVSIWFLGGFFAIIVIFNFLSSRLEKDFLLFVDFFKRATLSSEFIDRDTLKFKELDQLADYANQMLTDKTQIEQELDREKERLLVTLHSIADGVVATDTTGKVQLLNKVAEQLTGWSQAEARGKDLKDILQVHSPTANNTTNAINALAKESGRRNIFLTSRSGQEYRIGLNSAPIYIEDNTEIGNVVVFRDETEKVKTEEELLRTHKLESVGLLAGGIAHDFNNILSGIFGNIELAQIKLDKDEQVLPHLQIAMSSLQRAKSLTTQLLTFSKSGGPLIEVVNLKQILEDAIPFNLSGSSVKARYEISDNLWKLQADPGQISQVITNLVINAKHAMPMGGDLIISAQNILAKYSKLDQDSVELKINDNGVGMSPDIMANIFDPYFTTKQTGNGLGLAMVYSIIEKHKGVIDVESQPGVGTTFSILLLADNQPRNSPKVVQPSLSQAEVMEGLKILIIEDDEIVQEVLTNILEVSGYTTDIAPEGEMGVSMYQKALNNDEAYHLVISDLTIPGGMGGKEAVQKILAITPHAKVIATSGYATDPIMAHFEDYGFKGRIAKPFRVDDVHREIKRVYNCS